MVERAVLRVEQSGFEPWLDLVGALHCGLCSHCASLQLSVKCSSGHLFSW